MSKITGGYNHILKSIRLSRSLEIIDIGPSLSLLFPATDTPSSGLPGFVEFNHMSYDSSKIACPHVFLATVAARYVLQVAAGHPYHQAMCSQDGAPRVAWRRDVAPGDSGISVTQGDLI